MKLAPALLFLTVGSLYAQDGDVYFAAIKLNSRSPAVTGFLYSVSDSAVAILPARLSTKKALAAVAEKGQVLQIPVGLIRKVKLLKLKNVKGAILSGRAYCHRVFAHLSKRISNQDRCWLYRLYSDRGSSDVAHTRRDLLSKV